MFKKTTQCVLLVLFTFANLVANGLPSDGDNIPSSTQKVIAFAADESPAAELVVNPSVVEQSKPNVSTSSSSSVNGTTNITDTKTADAKKDDSTVQNAKDDKTSEATDVKPDDNPTVAQPDKPESAESSSKVEDPKSEPVPEGTNTNNTTENASTTTTSKKPAVANPETPIESENEGANKSTESTTEETSTKSSTSPTPSTESSSTLSDNSTMSSSTEPVTLTLPEEVPISDKAIQPDMSEQNKEGMSSGIVALVMAIVFAAVVIIVYVGLLLWRRYLEYRYGNRELLVNDLEFDTNDLRHFEL